MRAEVEARILRELADARARGVPASDGALRVSSREYGDASLHAAELERVFARSWIPVARESLLAHSGDFVSAAIGAEPVVVVRDGAELRALSNVCLHRGSVIARERCGNAEKLVCPFHGQTYALDGTLVAGVAAAEMERKQLARFALDRWGGWVWLRVADEGPALRDYLGPELEDELAEWELERAEPLQRWSAEGDFDWKLAVEAFLEPLHVAATHRETVHPLVDWRAASFDSFGPHSRQTIAFRAPNAFALDGPLGAAAHAAGVANFPRLNRAQLTSNFSYLIFPSTVLNLLPNHFTAFQVEPLAAGRARLSCELFAAPARDERAREFARSLERGYARLFDEDLANLAWIQRGCASRRIDELQLSRYETRIAHFREHVRRARQSP